MNKMTKRFATAGVFAVLLFMLLDVQAEPYLAVRTGFKCSQCHVNRTGGGKRNDFGVIYSQTRLYMKILKPNGRPTFFSGQVSQNISVGANLRADEVSTLSYETPEGRKVETTNNSRISEANIYLEADLVPDLLTFYLDQTLAPGNANREFWGMIHGLPANSYVKVGRMLLPFGFRLLDNDAFIRDRTGYTYNRHDVAVEVGLEPGVFAVAANLTADQLSLRGATVFRRFRVGASFGRNIRMSNEWVAGAFGGVNFGRFTVLGEGDFIRNGDVDRFAGFAELDFLVTRGLNFKFNYQFFDRNTEIGNDRDGQERFTIGVEPFLTQFLQMGIFYRINRFIPQNIPLNREQLTVQFHVFL